MFTGAKQDMDTIKGQDNTRRTLGNVLATTDTFRQDQSTIRDSFCQVYAQGIHQRTGQNRPRGDRMPESHPTSPQARPGLHPILPIPSM